jgi:hypothetical protein
MASAWLWASLAGVDDDAAADDDEPAEVVPELLHAPRVTSIATAAAPTASVCLVITTHPFPRFLVEETTLRHGGASDIPT